MHIHLPSLACLESHTCICVHHISVTDCHSNILFTQNVAGLHGEIRSLQSKLSEVSGTSIQQGERLREVRKAKRELDQENTDLKAALKNAQVCSKFVCCTIIMCCKEGNFGEVFNLAIRKIWVKDHQIKQSPI